MFGPTGHSSLKASPKVAPVSSDGEGLSSSFRPASSSSMLNPKHSHSVTASRALCWVIQAETGSPKTRSFIDSVMMECTG